MFQKLPSALEVANAFVAELRQLMTPEQFDAMRARNATAQPGVCHSHDFCDAHVAMEVAFHQHGVAMPGETDAKSPEQAEAVSGLWDEAWALARASLGHPGRLREPPEGSPYRKFWEQIKAGGRVWRDDLNSNVQEWLDLRRLGGDANEIQRFDCNDLAIIEAISMRSVQGESRKVSSLAARLADLALDRGRYGPLVVPFKEGFAVVVDGFVVNRADSRYEATQSATYIDADFWRGEFRNHPEEFEKVSREEVRNSICYVPSFTELTASALSFSRSPGL